VSRFLNVDHKRGMGSTFSSVARLFLAKSYQNWKNIPNDRKIYQMTIKYTKWPQNISNDHKIYVPNDRKIYQMTIK
jgi:hypothetical protein